MDETAQAESQPETVVDRRAEFYRAIVEESREGFLLLDAGGTIRHATAPVGALVGVAPESLIGRRLADFIVEADLPSCLAHYHELVAGAVSARAAQQSFRWLHPTRGPIWLEGTCTNLLGDPAIAAVVVNLRDVQDRHESREQLERSELFVRGVLDAVVANIAVVDATGSIVAVNASWERFGAENGAMGAAIGPGSSYLEVCAGSEEGAAAGQGIRDVLAGAVAEYSLEYPCHSPNERRFFLMHVVPFDVHPGRGAVITHMPITRRKVLEEELVEANARLEERVARRTQELESANRELEAFSYTVSHDLRAPVRAIGGFAAMISEKGPFAPDVERLLAQIRGSAFEMGRMIDTFLAFSRLGRQALSVTRVDMESLARAVWNELVATEPAPPVLLLHSLPAIAGDAQLLRQVWRNLLSNALKFTARRAERRIEVGASTAGDDVTFFVRDNGAGFDMQYAGRLFKVFERLHGRDEFEGSGAGLAIVQRIVARHGGRAWAEGVPNEGATFYFRLPVGASARVPS